MVKNNYSELIATVGSIDIIFDEGGSIRIKVNEAEGEAWLGLDGLRQLQRALSTAEERINEAAAPQREQSD